MNTVTLHAEVQRSRFAQLALGTLTSLVPTFLRLPFQAVPSTSTLSAAEVVRIEAQNVRELADSYSKTDPGFAADLYAAAARHEGVHVD
jgi:hypothetical protein